MISDHSFRLIRLSIAAMPRTFMFPYTWDYAESCVGKRSGRLRTCSLAFLWLNLLSSFYVCGAMGWSILNGGLKDSEKLLCLVGVSGVFFLIIIYGSILVYEDEIRHFVNACLDLNFRLGRFYNLNSKDKDGVETFLDCFLVAGLTVSVGVGPGCYFLLKHHPKLLPILVPHHRNIGNFFHCLHFAWNVFNAGLAIYAFIGTLFVMFNGNIRWFQMMSWSPTTTRKQMLRTRTQFRSIQILHLYVMEVILAYIMPLLVMTLMGLLVAVLFSQIKFHDVLNTYAQIDMIGFIVILSIVTQVVTKLFADVIEASKDYPKSYQKAQGEGKFWLSRQDEAFFRACRPLKIQVGIFFNIDQNVFLIVAAEVFVTTVNLLVSLDRGDQ